MPNNNTNNLKIVIIENIENILWLLVKFDFSADYPFATAF